MAEVILDSSILIDYLRGRTVADEYLDRLRTAHSLATHVVVIAEMLTGARDRHFSVFEGLRVVRPY